MTLRTVLFILLAVAGIVLAVVSHSTLQLVLGAAMALCGVVGAVLAARESRRKD